MNDVFPALHCFVLLIVSFFSGTPFPFPRVLSADFPLLLLLCFGGKGADLGSLPNEV